MNYEQKYKEAIERAKAVITLASSDEAVGAATTIFPELEEVEDERIRKELIEFIRHGNCVFDSLEQKNRFWGWLEKQGEQKPIEQDTENHDLWVYIKEWKDKFSRLPKDEDELVACIDYVMKRQKPAEWSEEDKNMFNGVILDLTLLRNKDTGEEGKAAYQREINWLKSLKPNHWKPSEQNIKDLEWCADLVKDKLGVGFHRLQVFIDEIKNL